ncbi:TetR/AcrR family transcriptional regulator [Streptomyces aurantiogriseus]|uniref:HTH tetR-type domain-containing protein n=1 Tax=Streptomyces aurantiogriseus TaxID=66870 RepID=A0A918L067_9ACTN|nr:hypothetical protein GCM10010251_95630 [Streptomyces aurantiogriseus]
MTLEAVAQAAGVSKGMLFRRFGDREGLLRALLSDAEADFQGACSGGPPPLGPRAPAVDRLTPLSLAPCRMAPPTAATWAPRRCAMCSASAAMPPLSAAPSSFVLCRSAGR